MVIGTRQLADWVGLIKLKEMAAKPDELTVTAMIRAQACEEIVTTLHPSHAAASYTVGLFSVLEALLDTPMADILEPLSLADEIVAALVDGTGVAGQVLQGVIAYEQARWDDARIEGIDDDAMSGIMRRAIDKTTRMWREVVE